MRNQLAARLLVLLVVIMVIISLVLGTIPAGFR
jgi:hypothetical protein